MNDRNDNTAPQLPYPLSIGVTATRDALIVDQDGAPDAWPVVTEWDGASPEYSGLEGPWIVPWDYAAERLRYRKLEPWCEPAPFDNSILCWSPMPTNGDAFKSTTPLHRIAAILCNNADAFRVLNWCVTELGGRQ